MTSSRATDEDDDEGFDDVPDLIEVCEWRKQEEVQHWIEKLIRDPGEGKGSRVINAST